MVQSRAVCVVKKKSNARHTYCGLCYSHAAAAEPLSMLDAAAALHVHINCTVIATYSNIVIIICPINRILLLLLLKHIGETILSPKYHTYSMIL